MTVVNSRAAQGLAGRLPEPELIERAVAELKEIDRQTGLDRTLAIGELVLQSFFAGEATVWRDRRRNKNNSIRRLAHHPGCPFCKSALNNAVGVFVAVRDLPCVRTFGHITSSHIVTVLSLTLSERESALRLAEEGRWSVRELRHYVTARRRREGERRGRPSASSERRALTGLQQAVHAVETSAAQLCQSFPRDDATREQAWALLERLQVAQDDLRLLFGDQKSVAKTRTRPHQGEVRLIV